MQDVREQLDVIIRSEQIRTKQLDEISKSVKELVDSVQSIQGGFPGGDYEGHRRYHEAVIEDMAERKKFYADIKSKTAVAALLGLGAYVVQALTHEIARMFSK